MGSEALRPAEAAARLGMAESTLRVYSSRFAELLTPSAARPQGGAGGGAGHRLYSERDIATLGRARDLVAEGLTYQQALDQLRPRQPSARPVGQPAPPAAPAPELVAHLATLQQAVDAWRALAEERAREVADLRRQLADARAELAAERRERLAAEQRSEPIASEPRGTEPPRSQGQGSWLARLFSGEAEGRDSPQ